jgi:hypothetical protein
MSQPTFSWLMVLSYPNNGEIAMVMVLFSELTLDTFFEMKTPAQIQNDDPEGSRSTHGFKDGLIDARNVLK